MKAKYMLATSHMTKPIFSFLLYTLTVNHPDKAGSVFLASGHHTIMQIKKALKPDNTRTRGFQKTKVGLKDREFYGDRHNRWFLLLVR